MTILVWRGCSVNLNVVKVKRWCKIVNFPYPVLLVVGANITWLLLVQSCRNFNNIHFLLFHVVLTL
jgi:hypothetical protein